MFEAISSLKFFSKMWLLAAQLGSRQSDLSGARAILGKAIGLAPKHKIFKNYIEMELRLVELERSLKKTERTRSLFELVIAQPELDMPELLWKEYIDFEIAESKFERTRQLYERLMDRTKHLKVSWLTRNSFFQDSQSSNLKILDQAYKWKKRKLATAEDDTIDH
ncbi:crooked neck-like protein 1 [Tanacetum coccineum]